MGRSEYVSTKCCATCIYWNGNVKFNPGFFGEKSHLMIPKLPNATKVRDFFSLKRAKGQMGTDFFRAAIGNKDID